MKQRVLSVANANKIFKNQPNVIKPYTFNKIIEGKGKYLSCDCDNTTKGKNIYLILANLYNVFILNVNA